MQPNHITTEQPSCPPAPGSTTNGKGRGGRGGGGFGDSDSSRSSPYVQADLCINNACAVYNTAMIAAYVRVDPRLAGLVFLVKARRPTVCVCRAVCASVYVWTHD